MTTFKLKISRMFGNQRRSETNYGAVAEVTPSSMDQRESGSLMEHHLQLIIRYH